MRFTKRFRVRVHAFWLTKTSKFCVTHDQRSLERVSKQIHDGHKSKKPNCHAFGTMAKPESFHWLGQLLRQHQQGLRQPSLA